MDEMKTVCLPLWGSLLAMALFSACAPTGPPATSLRQFGSPEGRLVEVRLAALPDGDLLMAGSFVGSVTIATESLISRGDGDLFLARFDPAGGLRYLTQAGGAGQDRLYALTTDDAGGAWIAGCYVGAASFGRPPREVGGGGWLNAFVARYHPDGALAWVATPHSDGRDEAIALVALPDGDIATGGYFSDTILLASGEPPQTMLSAHSSSAAFLARYAAGGSLVWARADGGERGEKVVYDLASLPGGDILSVGAFKEPIVVGRGEENEIHLKAAGVTDALLMRVSPEGRLVWARGDGGTRWDEADRVVARPDGVFFVAGVSYGEPVFGAGQPGEVALEYAGLSDVFLACYDQHGVVRWARPIGGPGDAAALDLALLPDGSVLLAGEFDQWQTLARGNGTLLKQTAREGLDFFLARYDVDGNLLGAWSSAAQGDEHIGSLAVVGNTIHAAGGFTREIRFGEERLTAHGDHDAFIATFDLDTLDSR